MSKKIVVLLGSPRRNGNSEMISDAFIQGAKQAGHESEKIVLQSKELHPCMACYGCRKTGVCVIHDDMKEILEKMIDADVIVLATPVYFYSMSAQLKMMIDRTLPRYTEIKNKEFYFIATAAANQKAMERTIDAMRGFTDCLIDAKVKDVIYGAGLYEKGEAENSEAQKRAYEAGLHV